MASLLLRRVASSSVSSSSLLQPVLLSGNPSLPTTNKRGIAFQARIKESNFILNEVLNAPAHYQKEGFKDVTPELVDGILQECAKFCENVLAPLYEVGDREGCKLDPKTHDVKTPTGWKEAYQQFAEGGWQSLAVPTDYGGQGLPLSLGMLKAELVGTANWSFGMYPGLSMGAVNTLLLHGSEEQKKVCFICKLVVVSVFWYCSFFSFDQDPFKVDRSLLVIIYCFTNTNLFFLFIQLYVTKMAEGTWSGTMCLTEPQCGSDLGQVKTKAIPQPDGTYKISGTKIFISCGEHDFTENIIHIVLARLPDSPPGTKGISLFLVPKHIVKPDGSLDSKKNLICARLEKKMGIHGSTTCEMQFEDSIGYLIGKPNSGLQQVRFEDGQRSEYILTYSTLDVHFHEHCSYWNCCSRIRNFRTRLPKLSAIYSPTFGDEIFEWNEVP